MNRRILICLPALALLILTVLASCASGINSSKDYDREKALIRMVEKNDPKATETLVAALHDPSSSVRGRASDLLLMEMDWVPSSTEEKIAFWIASMDRGWNRSYYDTSPADSLIKIGSPAVPELIDHLPRSWAVSILGEIGEPRAVEPLLVQLERSLRASNYDSQGQVSRRNYIIEALGKLEDPRAVESLVKALTTEEGEWARRRAAESLAMIDDPRVVPALLTAMSDRSPMVREEAASQLYQLDWRPEAFEVAEALGTIEGYEEFLESNPDGIFSREALERITALEDELPVVTFQGVSVCGLAKVEITIEFVPERQFIKRFQLHDSCSDGSTHSQLTADSRITVGGDGTFEWRTVVGHISADAAVGTQEVDFSLMCSDQKVSPCTEWEAKRVK